VAGHAWAQEKSGTGGFAAVADLTRNKSRHIVAAERRDLIGWSPYHSPQGRRDCDGSCSRSHSSSPQAMPIRGIRALKTSVADGPIGTILAGKITER